jgi:hypothetical protein
MIAPDLKALPQRPPLPKVIAVKHPQCHNRLIECRGTQLLDLPAVNKIVEDFSLADPRKFPPRVMLPKLANLPEILLLAAPSQRF